MAEREPGGETGDELSAAELAAFEALLAKSSIGNADPDDAEREWDELPEAVKARIFRDLQEAAQLEVAVWLRDDAERLNREALGDETPTDGEGA